MPEHTIEDIVGGMLAGEGDGGDISREALRELLGQLGIALPANIEDIEAAARELLEARIDLTQALAGAGDPSRITGPLEDRVRVAEDRLIGLAQDKWGAAAGGVTRAISEHVDTTITRREELTRREFLNIPTPEEFLDDFQVALATHVQELTQAGELSIQDGEFLLDNPGVLLNDYLADLGERASRGEDVFKPVGVEGEPELLGARPGRQETRQALTDRAAVTQTAEQAQRTATAAGGEVAGAITAGQTTAQRTEQERFAGTMKETEEIFARPKLGVVQAPSPLSFLQESFPAAQLKLRVAAPRGERRPTPPTTAITPRRVR